MEIIVLNELYIQQRLNRFEGEGELLFYEQADQSICLSNEWVWYPKQSTFQMCNFLFSLQYWNLKIIELLQELCV